MGGRTYVVAGVPRRFLDYPDAFAGRHFVISIRALIGAFVFVWGLGTILCTVYAGERTTTGTKARRRLRGRFLVHCRILLESSPKQTGLTRFARRRPIRV
jgi:hypothetical protein